MVPIKKFQTSSLSIYVVNQQKIKLTITPVPVCIVMYQKVDQEMAIIANSKNKNVKGIPLTLSSCRTNYRVY